MAEFFIVYHGQSMPETADEIVHEMAHWGDCMNSLGVQLIGQGTTVGKLKTLSAWGTTDDGGANPVGGYSIVEA